MRLAWLAGGAAVGALALIGFRAPAKSVRETAAGSESRPFALRRLTELPGAELQPTLSPDGRMIVYASAAAGNLDLYLLRVGGDRAIALTTDPADDSRAAFSPDGERIAFRSERDGGGLFVMGATGESVRRVTDAGFDPSWSPDGRRLVYATEEVVRPGVARREQRALDRRGRDRQEASADSPEMRSNRPGRARAAANRLLGEHRRAARPLDDRGRKRRAGRGDPGRGDRLVARVVARRALALLLERSRRQLQPLAGRDRPDDRRRRGRARSR